MQHDKIYGRGATRRNTECDLHAAQSAYRRVSPWKALVGVLFLLFFITTPLRVQGQTQGPLARIASPANKQEMKGSVTILGTAQSSTLIRYELAFANEPDLTNWTVFGGATQSVSTAGLGVWNTRPLLDGEYALRLQVFSTDGSVIETVVRNLKITNGNTGAPAAAPDNTASSNATASEPAATNPTPKASSFSFASIPTAFMRGVRYAIIGFVAFGAYLVLKFGLHYLRKRVDHTPIDYGS